ncbi:MAG: dihydroneopterin aldolase, partial [Chthoniobacterales bacterium]
MKTEFIEIKGLEVFCHIGVPDEERKSSQRLLLDFCLIPLNPFRQMEDEITATVDYDALTRDVKQFCEGQCCKLIETLADKITDYLISRYPLR